MNKPDLIDLMNDAMGNLYGGWHFYIHSSIIVKTPSRAALMPCFKAWAADNTQQIIELGNLILYVGGWPTTKVNGWRNNLDDPMAISEYAMLQEIKSAALYEKIAANMENGPTMMLPHIHAAVSRCAHLRRFAS